MVDYSIEITRDEARALIDVIPDNGTFDDLIDDLDAAQGESKIRNRGITLLITITP